jgi:ABC-type glutathione transport system ATPase component
MRSLHPHSSVLAIIHQRNRTRRPSAGSISQFVPECLRRIGEAARDMRRFADALAAGERIRRTVAAVRAVAPDRPLSLSGKA